MSSRAQLPAQPPPPFPEPILLCARRIPGMVLYSPSEDQQQQQQDETVAAANNDDGENRSDDHPKPFLQRQPSLAGNILLIWDEKEFSSSKKDNKKSAFMMQRKLKRNVGGTVRAGYVLKHPSTGKESATGSDYTHEGLWEVQTSTSGSYEYEMVAIKIDSRSTMHETTTTGEANAKSTTLESGGATASTATTTAADSEDEDVNEVEGLGLDLDRRPQFSALQMIAAHDPAGVGHVMGTSMIAKDHKHIYTVVPFHGEGTLLEYCASAHPSGRLPETEARFFFRQILQALETLQAVELCHRNLSLENVTLRGTYCSLTSLSNALRIPTSKSEDGSTIYHLIDGQLPAGSNPAYVAPEILRNEPFDGYAVDLWSAGVMLFHMLFRSDFLFAAPLPEDPLYQEICVQANLRQVVQRWQEQQMQQQEQKEGLLVVSEEALDLLQHMLHAEPKDRLTLSGVREHSWVTREEVAVPRVQPRMNLEKLRGTTVKAATSTTDEVL